MRPCHRPERQNQIGARADGIIQPVGTADHECDITVTALNPALQLVGKGAAGKAGAGFIKHNKRPAAARQRVGDKRVFAAFFVATRQGAFLA